MSHSIPLKCFIPLKGHTIYITAVGVLCKIIHGQPSQLNWRNKAIRRQTDSVVTNLLRSLTDRCCIKQAKEVMRRHPSSLLDITFVTVRRLTSARVQSSLRCTSPCFFVVRRTAIMSRCARFVKILNLLMFSTFSLSLCKVC
jgi:hypothetical protein